MKALAVDDALLEGMYWIQDAGLCSGVYVLEEGRTLIDAGNMYGLIDELQDIAAFERIERILITHSHFDHIGGMAEIYQVANPDIYIHPLAREQLNFHREPFPSFFEALEKDGKIKLIQDGDTIEGNPHLQAILTPGHTAADLCYFDSRSGALFSGDVVLPNTLQNGTVISKPDEFSGGRIKDKIESLQKLIALPVRHLMPGHGEPVLSKGSDQIKIALYALYKDLYATEPARAWIAMGHAVLKAGSPEEARQCAAKAFQLAADSPELLQLKEHIEKGLCRCNMSDDPKSD